MRKFSFLVALAFLAYVASVQATEYTSTNFVIKDPVIGSIGGYGSSSSFGMFSSGEFIVTGRSSATSFLGRFGFLYFPFVTAPTLSGTPGDAEVDLTWSTSTSGLGFNVSGYEVGQSTASGGPYTYTNVGNVSLSTRTGLTNGATYYFVVRTLDTFGNAIITSNEVSITPVASVTPPGGGGSSSGSVASTGVQFIGLAYPNATVVFLKNGLERARTKADALGVFDVVIEEIFDQTVLYTLYAQDQDGLRSLLLNYPYSIVRGVSARISGIKFAPTIRADKIAVKQGSSINFSGFALPNTLVELLITGPGRDNNFSTQSLTSGKYNYRLSTSGMRQESYEVRSHYQEDGRMSNTLEFSVGNADIFYDASKNVIAGDCNLDRVIDLKDFSVLAFWYQKPNPPECIDTNRDGIVNLTDFSILAFYWSG